MIPIKENCTANAIHMLREQATLIGESGWWKFYLLDGKAWAIDDDVVYRSDDKVETEIITNLCRELTKLIPRRIPLSDLFGPSNIELAT